jgi:hypothetical protein
MIIAKSDGRFGNQLFQYCGVLAVAQSHERIVLFGFEDLQAFLGSNRAPRVTFAPKRVHLFFKEQLASLAAFRILGRIIQPPRPEHELVRERGLFNIAIFQGGYCQNERFVTGVQARAGFPSPADTFGGRAPGSEARPTCFVHVRQGDYNSWPSEKDAAALPLDWFRNQIDSIKTRLPQVRFVVFSDDLDFARQLCVDSSIEIYEGGWLDSFHFMSNCDAGILSPSTFSWWAAYFSRASGKGGPFLAPEFWGGWRTLQWYPTGVKTSFLEYMPVSRDQN